MYPLISLLFLSILLINKSYAQEVKCPVKCICKQISPNEGFLKMTCGEHNKIYHLDELDLLNLASEIIQLNLSGNGLTSFFPKVELIALQKLNLSRNQLTELKAHQFNEVPNIKRLDLSANNIKHIDLLAFSGLIHLEKLKLNQNHISAITIGTFTPLEKIKQLDISNNPLVCDCSLLWLHDWILRQSVKLLSNPKCMSPSTFKGRPLRKLKIGDDIHCKSPAGNSGLPIIELRPNEDQVAFEGDSLTMQCFAPSISDSLEDPLQSGIQWTWLDSNPELHFSDIHVENELLGSAGRISSTLVIPKLTKNHTGIWNCQFLSLHGNHSKGITVVVISNETKYCPMTITKNNKGVYNWPRGIANFTITMPCESLNLNYDVTHQKASYTCTETGEWSNLNTTMCSYISDNTKILKQFSMVNTSIEESAKHFRNYTMNKTIFKDVVDLYYAVCTIENYVKYAPKEHVGTIASILMDSANNLMDLSRGYLRQTDLEYGTSRRLISATEKIALFLNPTNFHKNNLAIEIFPVRKENFRGLTCTLYSNPNNKKDSLFSCAPSHQQEISSYQGKITEASVTIPETLFRQLKNKENLTNKDYDILVAMHSNSKLFSIDRKRFGKEDVTSAVVGVQLVDFSVTNLTDPVYIMLRTPTTTIYEVTPFIPVWWNSSSNNGSGSWTSKGCRFSHDLQEHTVFSCEHFGYYGLLQEVTVINDRQIGARFKLNHPAVYVGVFILFTTFLIVILTYSLCYVTIQIPKKTKHSLINTWISISLLTFMYIFGIFQTEDVKLCQIVGMILHYFTLCSLLWMCVGVNCMYKRLSKNDIIGLQDDDLPSDYPIQKPILGLYLVGWGIGLIICGLSAAINMNEYASTGYCFLKTGPALSALYIPCIILVIFLVIFFLLIRCTVYNSDANGHLSEGTQATEHVDLDLLESEPNFPRIETRSISTKTASSDVEDPEHAPSAQLKAYVIFLFIYIMTWLSCAFATASPFHMISFEMDFFSILFAILSTTLSAFTLFFYCIARNDVRTQWVLLFRWLKNKRICRSRHVSDTVLNVPQIQIQPLPLPPVNNIESQIISRSTSRASTKSRTSNALKGAVDLNESFRDTNGAKINNVNLVVLHRAQYRTSIIPNIIENPTNAELFYNPHQSTVARKFFKRQKRKNNLPKPPRDVNSDTASVFSEPKLKIKNHSEQNMFGTNTKVNNTNIHVEQKYKTKHRKNPNIFSDSAEDFDSENNIPVDDIVKHAERLRDKELTRNKNRKKSSENNMHSVSQQCTLDYSSETISDSILDKMSPDKVVRESFNTTETSEAVPSVRRENSPLSVLTEQDNEYYQKSGKAGESLSCNLSGMDTSSVGGASTPRIYVNPQDSRLGKGDGRSRASSVSVSDLDELYQQIRRGPQSKRHKNVYGTSCLSDSEINSFISDNRQRRDLRSHDEFDIISDDVETRV
ncbi:adhesion G protein-coupled receptor A3 [Diorhabda carinulata]|uniref:adhesion G protein-coupled receptor A3 n=1 Tax=Diorhabda carinulata TaxID=1163345 RepID=UPI0025A24EE1|nr:adhesion G protein-coupled receptor A3 [Diorhabda carinulata]